MRLSLICYCFLQLIVVQAALAQQPLNGAWRLASLNGSPMQEEERVMIVSDTYFMFGQYTKEGNFVEAAGGTYTTEEGELRQVIEFHSEDSTLVGKEKRYSLQQDSLELRLQGEDTLLWERIEEELTPLSGAWRFSARVDEQGQVGERRVPGPRKTMKILSDGRFQWAAFNTQTGQFMGTGGGAYQLADDTYTEHILFFSRDDNKVDLSLEFQFKIEGDDWYHKGYGTTGKPVYEVWERVDGGME